MKPKKSVSSLPLWGIVILSLPYQSSLMLRVLRAFRIHCHSCSDCFPHFRERKTFFLLSTKLLQHACDINSCSKSYNLYLEYDKKRNLWNRIEIKLKKKSLRANGSHFFIKKVIFFAMGPVLQWPKYHLKDFRRLIENSYSHRKLTSNSVFIPMWDARFEPVGDVDGSFVSVICTIEFLQIHIESLICEQTRAKVENPSKF